MSTRAARVRQTCRKEAAPCCAPRRVTRVAAGTRRLTSPQTAHRAVAPSCGHCESWLHRAATAVAAASISLPLTTLQIKKFN